MQKFMATEQPKDSSMFTEKEYKELRVNKEENTSVAGKVKGTQRRRKTDPDKLVKKLVSFALHVWRLGLKYQYQGSTNTRDLQYHHLLIMLEWISNCFNSDLIKFLVNFLLAADIWFGILYEWHMNESVKSSLLAKKINKIIVPRGCTKYIHTPDFSCGKSFKAFATETYDKWLAEE